jgi:hypothetical protein
MRFNDVLDAEKLHDALSELLEIGDWRKLGGRLRFKVWRERPRIVWGEQPTDERYPRRMGS